MFFFSLIMFCILLQDPAAGRSSLLCLAERRRSSPLALLYVEQRYGTCRWFFFCRWFFSSILSIFCTILAKQATDPKKKITGNLKFSHTLWANGWVTWVLFPSTWKDVSELWITQAKLLLKVEAHQADKRLGQAVWAYLSSTNVLVVKLGRYEVHLM